MVIQLLDIKYLTHSIKFFSKQIISLEIFGALKPLIKCAAAFTTMSDKQVFIAHERKSNF